MHVPHIIPKCQTIIALRLVFDLTVAHVADHFLRLLAERAEYLILFQVGFQRFAIRMRFKSMDQLFDCFSPGVIFL